MTFRISNFDSPLSGLPIFIAISTLSHFRQAVTYCKTLNPLETLSYVYEISSIENAFSVISANLTILNFF